MIDIHELPSAGVEAEILRLERKSRSVSWGEGRPLFFTTSQKEGFCLRVLKEGRHGLIISTKIGSEALPDIVEEALQIAQFSPPDFHIKFGRPLPTPVAPIPIDEKLFKHSVTEEQDFLRDFEKKILSFDSRLHKVLKLQIQEEIQKTHLANTHSLQCETELSSVTLLGEVVVKSGSETDADWTFRSRRFRKDLDWEGVFIDLTVCALQSLSAKPISSGSYSVLFHPRVGCQLLDVVGQSLSAEAIQMDRSFLKNSLGKSIASEEVTMRDDPLRSDGFSSAALDDEGTPHQILTVIEEGILKEVFYDLKTASKDGRNSNGRGRRMRLASIPKPHPTNFYLSPGKESLDSLLSSGGKLFYVRDVMGVHTIDSVTGEFSLGAKGLLYDHGKLVQSVRGVTISGRIPDLLSRIKGVADDLTWFGDRGSPHFLVSPVIVAGT